MTKPPILWPMNKIADCSIVSGLHLSTQVHKSKLSSAQRVHSTVTVMNSRETSTYITIFVDFRRVNDFAQERLPEIMQVEDAVLAAAPV